MQNKKMVSGLLSLAVPVGAFMLSLAVSAADTPKAEYVCQLTGESSGNNSYSQSQITGADLGYPVTRGEFTYFFLGDTSSTFPTDSNNYPSGEGLLWTENKSNAVSICNQLNPVVADTQLSDPTTAAGTGWDPIKITNSAASGTDDGFDVPVDAFNVNDTLYMLYDRPDNANPSNGGILLTKESTSETGAKFNAILRVAGYGNDVAGNGHKDPGKFLNPVAVDSPNDGAITGIPDNDSNYIYILGKPDYLHTEGPYALRILKTDLSNYTALSLENWDPSISPSAVTVQYWNGTSWSEDEQNAVPINLPNDGSGYHKSPFSGSDYVSFYSIQWLPQYKKWLAVYANTGNDLIITLCRVVSDEFKWSGQKSCTEGVDYLSTLMNLEEPKIFYSMSDTLINGHWTAPVSILGGVAKDDTTRNNPYCNWVHVAVANPDHDATPEQSSYDCTVYPNALNNGEMDAGWMDWTGVFYGIRLLPSGFVDANPEAQPLGLKHFFVVSTLAPYEVHLMGITIPVPDPNGDRDEDGLTNQQEYEIGTSPTSTDTDGDETLDGDEDYDSDTIVNRSDNCISVINTSQDNHDNDSLGDACDPDDDNDTILDGVDNCPLTANTSQANHDGDAQGDACDTDDDNDGIEDSLDHRPILSDVFLDIDGFHDPSGNNWGFSVTNIGTDTGRAVARQNDGKLVVAGSSYTDSNYDFALTRYNDDGSLDTNFGTGGKVVTPVSTGSDNANAVIVLAADPNDVRKILAVGNANGQAALVRYNTDGTLDTAFGTDGIAKTSLMSVANAVVQQSDGKLVIAGSMPYGPTSLLALVRYNLDGSLDTPFGTNGRVISAGTVANSIIQQADGKLVAAGYNGTGFVVARFNVATGAADPSFDSDGKAITAIQSSARAFSVIQQTDGKLVVAGSATVSGNKDIALARYNSDGTLDTSFGSNGKMTTSIGSGNDEARSVVQRADGSLVVAGYSDNGSYGKDIALALFDGGDGGLWGALVTTISATGDDDAYALLQQPDKKWVVAGESSGDFAILRYIIPE
ncbi:MAG TPA: thrombospondin type 3 repeat-containing protein [Pseudomonadales bacterium]|nr:thrombospondin type 3 repeat-containing protein [Pseudomonadales bacterium]